MFNFCKSLTNGSKMSSNEYSCSKLDLKRATRLIASSLERNAGSKFASMKYTAPIEGAKFYTCNLNSNIYSVPILYFFALDISGLVNVTSSKYPMIWRA